MTVPQSDRGDRAASGYHVMRVLVRDSSSRLVACPVWGGPRRPDVATLCSRTAGDAVEVARGSRHGRRAGRALAAGRDRGPRGRHPGRRGGEAAQAHAPDAFEYLVPCVRDEV